MSHTSQDKVEAILRYIREERRRMGVRRCDRRTKPEGSGFAQGSNGDIDSLVDVQLMTTEEGFGAWSELRDPEILDLVYQLVEKRLAWQRRQ